MLERGGGGLYWEVTSSGYRRSEKGCKAFVTYGHYTRISCILRLEILCIIV